MRAELTPHESPGLAFERARIASVHGKERVLLSVTPPAALVIAAAVWFVSSMTWDGWNV